MKRLLWAGALAIGLHVLLLQTELSDIRKRTLPRHENRSVTVTLNYLQPEKPKPAIKKPVPPLKKIVPPKKKAKLKKLKQVPEKRPVKPQKKPLELPEVVEEIPTTKAYPEPSAPAEPNDIEKNQESDETIEEFVEDIKWEDSPASLATSVDITNLPVVQEAVPLYRINPPPKYPRRARKRGYQGTVVLEVLVDRDGRAKDLWVFTSSGYAILDRRALASVKGWLFEPGTRGNKRIEMWVRVPIRFCLK